MVSKLENASAQAAFYMYHGQDEESIAKVMEGADVVVNMVGKRYETKHVLPICKTTGKIDLFTGSRVNCRCRGCCRAP